jgi:hypothetical protein
MELCIFVGMDCCCVCVLPLLRSFLIVHALLLLPSLVCSFTNVELKVAINSHDLSKGPS